MCSLCLSRQKNDPDPESKQYCASKSASGRPHPWASHNCAIRRRLPAFSASGWTDETYGESRTRRPEERLRWCMCRCRCLPNPMRRVIIARSACDIVTERGTGEKFHAPVAPPELRMHALQSLRQYHLGTVQHDLALTFCHQSISVQLKAR